MQKLQPSTVDLKLTKIGRVDRPACVLLAFFIQAVCKPAEQFVTLKRRQHCIGRQLFTLLGGGGGGGLIATFFFQTSLSPYLKAHCTQIHR